MDERKGVHRWSQRIHQNREGGHNEKELLCPAPIHPFSGQTPPHPTPRPQPPHAALLHSHLRRRRGRRGGMLLCPAGQRGAELHGRDGVGQGTGAVAERAEAAAGDAGAGAGRVRQEAAVVPGAAGGGGGGGGGCGGGEPSEPELQERVRGGGVALLHRRPAPVAKVIGEMV